ncbi:MAG: 23S rRNA (uracil(1939)-C(5))-methyltransferase RlmD [Muribaculaceae bacterium]|nr:23S rRNA (uracil(1939)-C(5))-methyltransferase RlmD [Muribaculaceae bacterium]
MGRKKKELPLLKGIEISGMAAEGKAIAKVKMKAEDDSAIVIFVPYAAPGDIVDLQLDKKKRSYAEGHIVEMITPSPARCEPRCRHFGICGGCKWQHIPYEAQLEQKRLQVSDALTRIGKIDLPEIRKTLGSECAWGYRNKMEYTFSNKKWRTWEEIRSGKDFEDSSDALGFHIPGAFDKVLHIEECLLQEDFGNRLRNFIYDFAEKNALSFYDIRNNEGLLRTLMIRTASTGEKMVVVAFGADKPEEIKKVMSAIADEFPEITSLEYAVNLKLNDSLADVDIIPFRGPDYIEEEMEGLRFRINAKSFYQTNSRQAYELYKVARQFAGLEPGTPEYNGLQEKPLVYDLYTGTGTIANFVAREARKVIGIEYVEVAIEDARLNSQVNGIDNTLFYAGDMKDVLTDEFIANHGRPDIMIVDPPRAGMHEDVVKTILNAAPEVIVYVSCNPASQARDLAMMDAMYEVTAVQPVDMFPHTHHVENVVRLQKRQCAKQKSDEPDNI